METVTMTGDVADRPEWMGVDEGWGRKAAEFASPGEPSDCREYVTMHHRLGVDTGARSRDTV
jgi:hypothetical protein